jgi:hypothetical protein
MNLELNFLPHNMQLSSREPPSSLSRAQERDKIETKYRTHNKKSNKGLTHADFHFVGPQIFQMPSPTMPPCHLPTLANRILCLVSWQQQVGTSMLWLTPADTFKMLHLVRYPSQQDVDIVHDVKDFTHPISLVA